MDLLPAAGLAAAAGYLCGSIPFAYLAVRLRTGKDLRTVGSGNVGATNAARALGTPWFVVVFALDFAKGLLPVLGAAPLLRPGEDAETWVRAAAGMGAVLGHMFPVWLGFRGGKGVATGAGVVVGLEPLSCAAGLAGFLLVAGLSGYVSLGSVGAAVAVPSAYLLLSAESPLSRRIPVAGLLVALSLTVIVRHVPNFRRVAAGTEPKMFRRKPAAPGREAPVEE